MQGQGKKLPGVGFKKLKKILKRCRRDFQSQNDIHDHAVHDPETCPDHCPGPNLIQTLFSDIYIYIYFCYNSVF